MKRFGNTTGAFADGAVLFPLLAALTLQTGMSGVMLLATAGLAYIVAGWVFRVPMAVQPLKSVAVAALALGATAGEIAASGFAVGAVCLLLSFCKADSLAAKVPRHLVHGLQLALGILLMWKGAQWGLQAASPLVMLGFAAAVLVILIASHKTQQPVMGWVAAVGLLAGLVLALGEENSATEVVAMPLRYDIIFALVLPQLALTLTNSVVGTHDVAQRYFGAEAKRVTPARLLRSIGIGNLLSAPVGGLPFCHGSGGVTAHVKGGATSWHMNLIIGGTLLTLAAVSWGLSVAVIPAYPKVLMAVLLFATGWFHLMLAKPSWEQKPLRPLLLVMAATTLLTKNMLWVLVAGVLCEGIRHIRRRAAA